MSHLCSCWRWCPLPACTWWRAPCAQLGRATSVVCTSTPSCSTARLRPSSSHRPHLDQAHKQKRQFFVQEDHREVSNFITRQIQSADRQTTCSCCQNRYHMQFTFCSRLDFPKWINYATTCRHSACQFRFRELQTPRWVFCNIVDQPDRRSIGSRALFSLAVPQLLNETRTTTPRKSVTTACPLQTGEQLGVTATNERDSHAEVAGTCLANAIITKLQLGAGVIPTREDVIVPNFSKKSMVSTVFHSSVPNWQKTISSR